MTNDEISEDKLENVTAALPNVEITIDKALENRNMYREEKIRELEEAKEELLKSRDNKTR